MRTATVLTSIAIAVLLTSTGCAEAVGTSPDPAPSASAPLPSEEPSDEAAAPPSSAEPAPMEALAYDSAEEFRVALVEAGASCDAFEPPQFEGDDLNICTPGQQWMVRMFPNEAELDAALQLSADSIEPGSFLIGPNWVLGLGYDTPEEAVYPIQQSLGGDFHHWSDPATAR